MTTEPTDYSRKWFIMLAVGMGIFLSTVDGSIMNVALPTLQSEFGTSFSAVQWAVLAYSLTLGTFTLMVGRIGDIYGKKRLYTAGFLVFTAASAMAGLSPSIGALIGFRVLQALGASMVLSLGIAILTEGFPPSERGRALGLSGTIVSVGIAIGPGMGGLILDRLSWRWIFLVNIPIGLVGAFTASRFVPATAPKQAERFDYAGAAVLGVGLTSLMLSVTLIQDFGFTSALVMSLGLVAALSLVVFVRIERSVESPMIDLTMFRNPLFTVNLVTGFLTFVSLTGIFVIMPFFLEVSLGYPTLKVGLLLGASPILLGIVAPISGWLSDKIGSRPITIGGLLVLAGGYLLMRGLDTDSSEWFFLAALAPIGVGMGMFQSPNNSIVMGSVRPERLGIASGLLNLTRILGQITGIGVIATIWSIRAAKAGGQNSAEGIVAGLGDVLWLPLGMMLFALALAIWGYVAERRSPDAAPAHL
ncbi:MAG: DHA2 family efflux MFS transporter permease subunit [Acidimicrobiia bacterium]|nr:DHA2 family efflux MFS transporter permease subunit [Acidimicrobiia bacterium]